MAELLIGIDGGGTGCRAAVATQDGRVLGQGTGGPANILTEPESSLTHLISAAGAALADAGLAPERISEARALLGLAGSNVGEAVHMVKARLPFRDASIESDVLISLEGALPEGDGAVAALGTGTVYAARQGGEVSYLGGWGFAVGDLGSGARLGQALLQESLLAHDGIRPGSPLTAAVLAEFEGDPRAIVDFARKARPVDFGRHAPRLFDCAAKGDAVALRIVREGAASIDAAIDVLVRRGIGRLCLLGGLARVYEPFLAGRHRPLFVAPEADALAGAVRLAVRRYGALAEAGR
ncbi:BadF/BadG/BcrA/BcrD ATPase family protein [Ensifer soli]|uniref:BadF/BadG/BcrA/BcrD ATPase family protein n=1 Tax=Ciceribacter sp. sgz301302 TaxID=3342379 RepID=UPI0035B9EB6C